MGKNLLIDDLRDENMLAKRGVRNPGLSFTDADTARTPEDAKRLLMKRGWDTVFLDNDLGDGASMEGHQILRWLLYEMIDNKWPKSDWPKRFVLVTDNIEASKTMESLLRSSRTYKSIGTIPSSWEIILEEEPAIQRVLMAYAKRS